MHCPNCGKTMRKAKRNYHYTESGLDNVIIQDLGVFICDCGEEMPVIPSIEGLHKVIAFAIIQFKILLTGPQIRFLRKEMGYKAFEFAKLVGTTKTSVSRWETGKEPIGPANDRLIRLLMLRKLEQECKIKIKIASIFTEIGKHRKVPPINIPISKLKELQPCH